MADGKLPMFEFSDFAVAMLRFLPAETAHKLTLWGLVQKFGPRATAPDPGILKTEIWGQQLSNPVGMAAGFDKSGTVIEPVLNMGFGFHDVGGITPLPQPGNPRPRLFRLSQDRALINRMGFNNDGMEAIAHRIMNFRQSTSFGSEKMVGANLAANTDSKDAIEDFVNLYVRLAPLVDFLTIDISCPNTKDGQQFLSPGPLAALLAALTDATKQDTVPTPRLIKLSPDIEQGQLGDILTIALGAGIDGIIVSNTSANRPASLLSRQARERGGLSGEPLKGPATQMLASVYRQTQGEVPLIGVGGISSGSDAYARIRAGATLVQLYTGLVYEGPGLLPRLKADLAARLAADGFSSIAEAIGADHR